MSIEQEIIDIVAKQIKRSNDGITADYDLSREEAIDSIDHMEIVMAIESLYGIGIEDQEVTDNPKISDLVKLVESKR